MVLRRDETSLERGRSACSRSRRGRRCNDPRTVFARKLVSSRLLASHGNFDEDLLATRQRDTPADVLASGHRHDDSAHCCFHLLVLDVQTPDLLQILWVVVGVRDGESVKCCGSEVSTLEPRRRCELACTLTVLGLWRQTVLGCWCIGQDFLLLDTSLASASPFSNSTYAAAGIVQASRPRHQVERSLDRPKRGKCAETDRW